jgi:predicted Zn-dependent protease
LLFPVLVLLVLTGPAQARGFSLIRDAEIENTIRMFGTPLFAMAGLEPAAVRVYLVKDSSLNAFVAGGQNIFINTGLLIASDSANQVVGVIAHETGHITGGHLARTQDALRDASAQSILAMVLGAAAAVAGQGGAGGAIIAGGVHVAQRSLLRYSRVQESSADQAAMDFLDQTGQSALGMLQFFEKLGDQEALLTASQDPYVRSHPLTRERVNAVRAHVERSRQSDLPDPPAYVEAHARMKAKLIAFLQSAPQTLRQFPESDTSLPARYARAIARYRQRQTDQALAEVDALIAERPADPYFHELKGQILLEHGHAEAAIPPYAEAVRLLPNEALLRIALGQAQVSAKSAGHLEAAVKNLEKAIRLAPREPGAWRWLGMAHGRQGDIGRAALATAERYMLLGKFKDAMGQARRATKALPAGSPGQLRAQDILQAAKAAAARKKRR